LPANARFSVRAMRKILSPSGIFLSTVTKLLNHRC
jgi:hypothetical protein